ncbi:zinc ABC transporter permease AztB [Leucobacter chinensis]|uniref:zinc ABC transporter permease AztB n=1 Tax=Leucobacter chinensis TaxID=2851010 RepID=UPI001C235672
MIGILEPFQAEFMQRALLGGAIVAVLSAVVGTWVVLRGMAFLGEALSHGMLPGVATAVLLGLPGQIGALVAAAAMTVGIGLVTRRKRIAGDTAIGLLFVGMLAVGVIIVSASKNVTINLTAILFGDVLALTWGDIALIASVGALVIAVFTVFRRPFTALVFDERIAHSLRFSPRISQAVLMGGVALTIVVSYQAVGTLLVVGMLLAPAATGAVWAKNITQITIIAIAVGIFSVWAGLTASWFLEWAAGPSIALVAVLCFGASAALKRA